jgi:hypothetical protein
MKRKLKDLFLSDMLLNIRPLNNTTVNKYKRAMKSGHVFPPIHAQKKTGMILSGQMRYAAYLKVYADTHKIDCIDVPGVMSIADILEYFLQENIKHGEPLTSIQTACLIQELIKAGKTPDELAAITGLGISGVKQLNGQVVAVVLGSGKNKTVDLVSKKSFADLVRNKKITEEQYTYMRESVSAMPITAMARQIVKFMQNGWIKETDINDLILLYDGLRQYFSAAGSGSGSGKKAA